ncbi:MAG: DUF1990 family protein [Gemmatimonadota bacterium]
MAEWRVQRGWTEEELAERLERLQDRRVNFDIDPAEMTPAQGWNRYTSEATIAHEPPGSAIPDGPFKRAEVAVANYQFSDPSIVVGHFDATSRLLGRRMLLEMKAVRVLHYLAGVVIGAVRFEEQDGRDTFGFRYDTLEGHIECGSEWFLLTKHQDTGEIRFRIEAAWRPGQFPNWWSRIGFRCLGPRYQRRWHHEAHHRLFRVARHGTSGSPAVDRLGLAHTGPEVHFERAPRYPSVEKPRWDEEETITSS